MLMMIVSTALMAAAPTPQAVGDAPQVTAPPPTVKKDRKICRRQAETGSMLTKSICHTSAEWKAISDQANPNVDDLRNHAVQGHASNF